MPRCIADPTRAPAAASDVHEQRTLEREGKAITNFEQQLPKPQSDLARESFLSVGADANEREIEPAFLSARRWL